jgi:hypothetical protein
VAEPEDEVFELEVCRKTTPYSTLYLTLNAGLANRQLAEINHNAKSGTELSSEKKTD